MYVVERLVGVLIYTLLLLFVYILLIRSGKKYKNILAFYVIVLAIMAFCYVPPKSADLYSINELMGIFSHYRFGEFFETFVITSTVPVARILYWLISKTGCFEILPMLATVVTYVCVFYSIVKTAEKYNISNRNIANTVFFCMSVGNYIYVVSNIRTMIALALICFCMYREIVEHKHNPLHLVLYIIAAFTHNLAVVVLLARAFFALFVGAKKTYKNMLKCMVILLLACVVLFLASNVFSSLFTDILNKTSYYVYGDSYSYSWEYLMGVIICIMEVVSLSRYKKMPKDSSIELNKVADFAKMIVIIAIVFCMSFSIFYRLVAFLVTIIILPIMMVLMQSSVKKVSYTRLILVMSVAVLFIGCLRGSMSSLKFFVM